MILTLLILPILANADYKGLGKESVSAETLKQYAPASLDPAISSKIQTYMDLSSIPLGKLSSDGKTLYQPWRVTGNLQIWRVDKPMAFPIQMTGGTSTTSLFSVSNDGKYIFLHRDVDGSENPGLFYQLATGGPLKTIFRKDNVKAEMHYVASDSRTVYFITNEKDKESYGIYTYNIETGETNLVFDQPGLWGIADVWKDEILLLQKDRGGMIQEYYIYSLKDKKLNPVFGQNESLDCSVSFATKPNEFFVLTNKLEDFKALYLLKGSQFKKVSQEKNIEIDGFHIDQSRTRVLLALNDRGYSRFTAISATSHARLNVPTFKDAEHVAFGSTTRNGRFTVISADYAQKPRESFVYDWQNSKLTKWVQQGSPEVDMKTFTVSKVSSYKNRLQIDIPTVERIPPQCEKALCPVIVSFHGGPEGQSFPGISIQTQVLNDQGYIVVEPNVRGSTGYGRKWVDADNGILRLEIIYDIEDAAIELRKKFTVNGCAKNGCYGRQLWRILNITCNDKVCRPF
jgi:protease II